VESQRDSATKPRVARNELPWEHASHIGDNPERVVADDNGNKTMPQPLWGCESSVTFPRVARSSQPWALLRNPFGIEDTGKEQRLAGAFARLTARDEAVKFMSFSAVPALLRTGKSLLRKNRRGALMAPFRRQVAGLSS